MNNGSAKAKAIKFKIIDPNGKGVTERLLKLVIIEKINSIRRPLNIK